MKKITIEIVFLVLALVLLGLAAQCQPTINLRRGTSLPGSSGLSVIVGRGTAVDTTLPSAALQSLRTNSSYTNFEWYTPSAYIDSIYKNSTKDSIIYTKNGNRYAIKDSTGSGSGTVSSVSSTAGWGLIFTGTTPITTTGTITYKGDSTAYATASVTGYLKYSDWVIFNSKGSGSVTSINLTAGLGMAVSGGPITTSGSITVTLDTANVNVLSRTRAANTYAPISVNGTVTSITAGSGLTGGTITTTGTLKADTTLLATQYWVQGNRDLDYLANAALGSSFKGGPTEVKPGNISAAAALTSQQMLYRRIYIPVACTITGVNWYQTTAGNALENNYNGVCLYSYSGGTLTLVDSTTRDTTMWTGTSGSWRTKAFAQTYQASAGVYYLAAVYSNSSQTTNPAIGGGTALHSAAVSGFDFTNSAFIIGVKTGTTTPPLTIAASSISKSNLNIYLSVY